MNDGAVLIKKDSTDITLQIKLRSNTTGALLTGVTITDLDLYYIRVEDDEDVTLSAKADFTALTALTDAHTDNKAIEIGLGYYRIDIPDAAFATGVTTGSIIVVDGSGTPAVLTATIDFQLVDFNPYDLKSEIVDEFETQSQADPTGFHVNTMEVVGLTPLTLADIRPESVVSLVRNDSTTSTASIIYTELTEATANHFRNLTIYFTSGVLAGQGRRVSTYSHDGTDGIVTPYPAFTEAPGDNDTFVIGPPYFYMPLAGAKEFTYTVKDGASNPIAGVTVWISTDEAGSQIVWSGISDANGVPRDDGGNKPWLDVGTVYVWKQKAGYIDDDWPDTEVVS